MVQREKQATEAAKLFRVAMFNVFSFNFFGDFCLYIHFWKAKTFLNTKTENFFDGHLEFTNGHHLTAVLTVSHKQNTIVGLIQF